MRACSSGGSTIYHLCVCMGEDTNEKVGGGGGLEACVCDFHNHNS